MRFSRLLLVLFLLIIFSVVILATFKGKFLKSNRLVDEVPQTFSGIAPTPAVPGVDNWRDYRNLEQNYAFRYPKDWLVAPTLPSEPGTISEAVLTSPTGLSVTVTVFSNENKLNSKQMADKFVASYSAELLERSELTLGGLEGERVVVENRFGVVAVTKGEWTYRIVMSPYASGDNSNELYSKILATFYFI